MVYLHCIYFTRSLPTSSILVVAGLARNLNYEYTRSSTFSEAFFESILSPLLSINTLFAFVPQKIKYYDFENLKKTLRQFCQTWKKSLAVCVTHEKKNLGSERVKDVTGA